MLMMIMDVIGILRLWNVRTSMRHNQALKECRTMMSSLTFRIYRGLYHRCCDANHRWRARKQGSKEREWSVEGVMMLSLTPQDPRPIDQERDSHDTWCLLSWHEYVSEDVVFVERRRRWWMREMITLLTLLLLSLISTFLHFPFVFPHSYWRVQQSHIHGSHSNPLGTPQRRRKCMITHWRGHFTYYMSLSKVLVGCSHRIEYVVMVASVNWGSYSWFVMIAHSRSCTVGDISQCHRMKWDIQS